MKNTQNEREIRFIPITDLLIPTKVFWLNYKRENCELRRQIYCKSRYSIHIVSLTLLSEKYQFLSSIQFLLPYSFFTNRYFFIITDRGDPLGGLCHSDERLDYFQRSETESCDENIEEFFNSLTSSPNGSCNFESSNYYYVLMGVPKELAYFINFDCIPYLRGIAEKSEKVFFKLIYDSVIAYAKKNDCKGIGTWYQVNSTMICSDILNFHNTDESMQESLIFSGICYPKTHSLVTLAVKSSHACIFVEYTTLRENRSSSSGGSMKRVIKKLDLTTSIDPRREGGSLLFQIGITTSTGDIRVTDVKIAELRGFRHSDGFPQIITHQKARELLNTNLLHDIFNMKFDKRKENYNVSYSRTGLAGQNCLTFALSVLGHHHLDISCAIASLMSRYDPDCLKFRENKNSFEVFFLTIDEIYEKKFDSSTLFLAKNEGRWNIFNQPRFSERLVSIPLKEFYDESSSKIDLVRIKVLRTIIKSFSDLATLGTVKFDDSWVWGEKECTLFCVLKPRVLMVQEPLISAEDVAKLIFSDNATLGESYYPPHLTVTKVKSQNGKLICDVEKINNWLWWESDFDNRCVKQIDLFKKNVSEKDNEEQRLINCLKDSSLEEAGLKIAASDFFKNFIKTGKLNVNSWVSLEIIENNCQLKIIHIDKIEAEKSTEFTHILQIDDKNQSCVDGTKLICCKNNSEISKDDIELWDSIKELLDNPYDNVRHIERKITLSNFKERNDLLKKNIFIYVGEKEESFFEVIIEKGKIVHELDITNYIKAYLLDGVEFKSLIKRNNAILTRILQDFLSKEYCFAVIKDKKIPLPEKNYSDGIINYQDSKNYRSAKAAINQHLFDITLKKISLQDDINKFVKQSSTPVNILISYLKKCASENSEYFEGCHSYKENFESLKTLAADKSSDLSSIEKIAKKMNEEYYKLSENLLLTILKNQNNYLAGLLFTYNECLAKKDETNDMVDLRYKISMHYEKGIYVSQNFEKMFSLYLDNTKCNDRRTMYKIGKYYFKYCKHKHSKKVALLWFLRSLDEKYLVRFLLSSDIEKPLGVHLDSGKIVYGKNHYESFTLSSLVELLLEYLKKIEPENFNKAEYKAGICCLENPGFEGMALKFFLKLSVEGYEKANFFTIICGINDDKEYDILKKDNEEKSILLTWLRNQNSISNDILVLFYLAKNFQMIGDIDSSIEIFETILNTYESESHKKSYQKNKDLSEYFLNNGKDIQSNLIRKTKFHLAENYVKHTEKKQKAFQLYLSSAKSGSVDAMYALAKCYHTGIGVNKDLIQAKYWYLKISNTGNIEYQLSLLELFIDQYESSWVRVPIFSRGMAQIQDAISLYNKIISNNSSSNKMKLEELVKRKNLRDKIENLRSIGYDIPDLHPSLTKNNSGSTILAERRLAPRLSQQFAANN